MMTRSQIRDFLLSAATARGVRATVDNAAMVEHCDQMGWLTIPTFSDDQYLTVLGLVTLEQLLILDTGGLLFDEGNPPLLDGTCI